MRPSRVIPRGRRGYRTPFTSFPSRSPSSPFEAPSLLGYRWKPSLQSSTITHTSQLLLSPSDVLPSCVLLDGDGLICRPVQEATQSWAISSTYPPPTYGRNLLNLVNNTVRSLSLISIRSSFLHRWMLTNLVVGEITYLNVLGRKMIILNSSKAAVDLLDKRSSIYSERRGRVLAGEIIGWKKSLGFMPYGSRFREFRKYMNRSIGTRASVEKYAPLLEKETARLVARVTADPGSLAQYIRK